MLNIYQHPTENIAPSHVLCNVHGKRKEEFSSAAVEQRNRNKKVCKTMGQVSSQKSIFKSFKRTNRTDGARSKRNGEEG